MKVATNLKAGAYIAQAQDQAGQFFAKTDQMLENATKMIDQSTAGIGAKLSRTWNCILKA